MQFNAPAPVMESMIADGLPQGMHAETREVLQKYKRNYEKSLTIPGTTFEEYKESSEGQRKYNKLVVQAQRDLETYNKEISDYFGCGEYSDSEKRDTIQDYIIGSRLVSLTETDQAEIAISKEAIEEQVRKSHKKNQKPYLPNIERKGKVLQPMLEFMKECPPILSWKDEQHLVVYEGPDFQDIFFEN